MSNTIMRGVLAVIVFAGLLFALASTSEAGGQLGTSGNNHYNQPNHSGGIGGCNNDGSFCLSIDIDQGGYHNPVRPYPGQVFGFQAKNLISYGQITYANLNSWGIMQLGVYNRGWPWECEIDLRTHMAQYRCTAQ